MISGQYGNLGTTLTDIYFFLVGENIEELFTRIAVVAFETTMMKEIEATARRPSTNGQLSSNSNLICNVVLNMHLTCQYAVW